MVYDRALIIGEPWIDKILSLEKVWEMRSRKTKIRGRIGLIKKGSGLIVGDAYLSNCVRLQKDRLHTLQNYHGINYGDNPDLMKYDVAWELRDVVKYDDPIPYTHRQGAVVWVVVSSQEDHINSLPF